MKILGIETSCDDTAVALIDASGNIGSDFKFKVLGNATLSQKEHEQYGGVFPNIAKREHGKNLVPVMADVLRQANMLEGPPAPDIENVIEQLKPLLEREQELHQFLAEFLRMYKRSDIDCIAVTYGPGLEPALWVGINFAKALAKVWNLPIVAVNHMEGHIIMSLVQHDEGNRKEVIGNSFSNTETYTLPPITFPMLSLLISGGHTELVLSRLPATTSTAQAGEWMKYELIGKTRDDAVGEAFDKVARMLGLPYPGGPHISRLASGARENGHKPTFSFTPPMLHSKDYDFSFAGLKTEISRAVETHRPLSEENVRQIALAFENAATQVLVEKTSRAIEEHSVRSLVVGGGVSANQFIRASLRAKLQNECEIFFSPPELSTDNALMIALVGYFRAMRREFAVADSLHANGSLRLDEVKTT